MNVTVPLGFSGVCAVIAAIAFWLDKPQIGGLFIAIAIIIVIISMWWGRGGA